MRSAGFIETHYRACNKDGGVAQDVYTGHWDIRNEKGRFDMRGLLHFVRFSFLKSKCRGMEKKHEKKERHRFYDKPSASNLGKK